MYLYQKNRRHFAQVADDVKTLAETELRALGATETRPAYRGIHFSADPKALYGINYQSRLISRVLAPLVSFDCHSDHYLYRRAAKVEWEDFFDASQTFAVFATVTHSAIKHSKFAALRLKDAIVDYFRDRTGERPSIDTRNPDVWINLHIENNEATISLDTSGGSLHRRGYREKSVEAPMVETLAAAILQESEWSDETPFYDPFCGSGTLLCEAYLLATGTPSGFLRRRYGFENLPDFDSALWNQVRTEAANKIQPAANGLICGSDISPQAVGAARDNCAAVDKDKLIDVEQRDVFEIESLEGKAIICNPPYGIRIGKGSDLSDFYKKFGDFLKQRCRGSTAYIYFGERKYVKNLGLRSSWKKAFSNGGLDGRLVKYELY